MKKQMQNNIDISTNTYLNSYKCKQGDIIKWVVDLSDLGASVDLTGRTVICNIVKANNTFLKQTNGITITGSKLEIILDQQSTQIPGQTKLSITISKATEKITTFSKVLEVEKNDTEDLIPSSNIVTIIDQLDAKILEGNTTLTNLNTAIANGDLVKIKQDITKNTNDIATANAEVAKKVNTVDYEANKKVVNDSIATTNNNLAVTKDMLIEYNKQNFMATCGEQFSNALVPLWFDIPNQYNHPSVLYFENGWNGHKYWMGNTAYTNSNDQVENPSLWFSEDGISWTTYSGNPIEPTPTEANCHNSDVFLLYNDKENVIEIWWRWRNKITITDKFFRKKFNGSTLTAKQEMFSANATVLSPSLLLENDRYVLYTIENGKLYRRISNYATPSVWSVAELCTTPSIRTDYQLWHGEVRRLNGKLIFLYNDFPKTGNVGGNLYIVESSDSAYNFTTNNKKLLEPGAGNIWDGGTIYKSSIIYANGVYSLYYSASNKISCWGIGLLRGVDLDSWFIPLWSKSLNTNPDISTISLVSGYVNVTTFNSLGNVNVRICGRKMTGAFTSQYKFAMLPWYLVPSNSGSYTGVISGQDNLTPTTMKIMGYCTGLLNAETKTFNIITFSENSATLINVNMEYNLRLIT